MICKDSGKEGFTETKHEELAETKNLREQVPVGLTNLPTIYRLRHAFLSRLLIIFNLRFGRSITYSRNAASYSSFLAVRGKDTRLLCAVKSLVPERSVVKTDDG